MTFRIAPAVREKTFNLVGLAGPSHSGKTRSALMLATGMANGGEIAFLDTENNRALHYAGHYRFQHVPFDPPFSPQRYLEAIRFAMQIKPAVIVIDSMSHEHEGEGGVLDMHDAELHRMAGNDYAKRERVKFTAWIAPKQDHNDLVNELIRLPCHVICCFRAKDKLVLKKNDRGKQEPVSIGWTPITPDRFDYEMTDILVLPPGAKGVPDLSASSTKMNDDHRAIFRDGEPITEDMGRQLRAWAEGGAPPASSPSASPRFSDWLQAYRERLVAAPDLVAVQALMKDETAARVRSKGGERQKEALAEVENAALQRFAPASDEDVFSGSGMET